MLSLSHTHTHTHTLINKQMTNFKIKSTILSSYMHPWESLAKKVKMRKTLKDEQEEMPGTSGFLLPCSFVNPNMHRAHRGILLKHSFQLRTEPLHL